MNYSDEQYRDGEDAEIKIRVEADADSDTMPKIVPVPSASAPKTTVAPHDDGEGVSFADELVSAIFKTLFIALSLIAILACIIAVALPLTSMRIFNSLGMSERAVDFGERYIAGELASYKSADGKRTAAYSDEYGNMPVLTATPALTNDDFIEALYVCNRLSNKLLTESLKSGDTERAKYYAERLEKYTRTYLSLNGLSAVTIKTNANNIASMPSPALRPIVYSYEHDMRVLNYRARAVLGNTEYMATGMFSGNGAMRPLSQSSESFFIDITLEDPTQRLDHFVDYIDQLGAYLDVEFMKLGVETDLDKKFTVEFNGREITATLQSEIVVRAMYGNKLNGNEFSLFVTPLSDATESSNGYTRLFDNLGKFTQYAQWAVDTLPTNEDDGALHQLYWLRALASVSKKLNYMEMLLYYNSERLGMNGAAIRNAYPICDKYMMVDYNNPAMSGVTSYQLSEVYRLKLQDYIAQYQS